MHTIIFMHTQEPAKCCKVNVSKSLSSSSLSIYWEQGIHIDRTRNTCIVIENVLTTLNVRLLIDFNFIKSVFVDIYIVYSNLNLYQMHHQQTFESSIECNTYSSSTILLLCTRLHYTPKETHLYVLGIDTEGIYRATRLALLHTYKTENVVHSVI